MVAFCVGARHRLSVATDGGLESGQDRRPETPTAAPKLRSELMRELPALLPTACGSDPFRQAMNAGLSDGSEGLIAVNLGGVP